VSARQAIAEYEAKLLEKLADRGQAVLNYGPMFPEIRMPM
jgi:hypothetical protein